MSLNRRDYFELWYGETRSISLETIRSECQKFKLKDDSVRVVTWMVFKGLLDVNYKTKWVEQVKALRGKYDDLFKRYIEDESTIEPSDAEKDNPLSQEKDSKWGKFFQTAEERRMIRQDIERCNQEYSLYQRADIKDKMERILYIYTRENGGLGYKQGMHDILAPVIYITEWESIKVNEEAADEDIYPLIYNTKYSEHIAYSIFEKIMEEVAPWFETGSNGTDQVKVKQTLLGGSAVGMGDIENDLQSSPIHKRCKHIFYDILKEKDPTLYSKLNNVGISPHIYLIRWLRVLFSREFHIEDLILIWDTFFAVGKGLELVDYFSIAMLLHFRDEFLDCDDETLLAKLFKFPQIENVESLVKYSLKVKEWTGTMFEYDATRLDDDLEEAEKNKMAPAAAANGSAAVRNSYDARGKAPRQQPQKADPIKEIAQGFTSVVASMRGKLEQSGAGAGSQAHRYGKGVRLSDREKELMDEISELKIKYVKLSSVIKRVVTVLTEELHNDVEPKSFDEDKVFMAMAELKVVKDVMIGQLDEVPDGPIYESPLQDKTSDRKDASAQPPVQEVTFDTPKEIIQEKQPEYVQEAVQEEPPVEVQPIKYHLGYANPFDSLSNASDDEDDGENARLDSAARISAVNATMNAAATTTTTTATAGPNTEVQAETIDRDEDIFEKGALPDSSIKNTSVRDMPMVNPFLDE